MEILGLTPLEWVVPIVIGVVAGFFTNMIAIWMLFHPYEDVYFAGIRILPKGAVPKEIDRIARRIGEAVGTELLTPHDIARTLSSDSFRSRFDEVLRSALHSLLDRDLGPLREIATPEQTAQLESALDRLLEKALEALESYLNSPEWEARVHQFARDLTGEFRDRELSVLLTPELQTDLTVAARELWATVRESETLERVVGDALERAIGNVVVSKQPLRHYLPTGAVNLGESVVSQYLPVLLERLGEVLDDAETRARLQETLRRFAYRFLEEQRTWKRIVGRFVITERTLAQTVEAIEQGGVEEIAALLREPDVQARVASAVNAGVEDLLDRPVGDLLGDVTPERAERLKHSLTERVLHLVDHPSTERVVIRRLETLLHSASSRTVGDLLELVGEDRGRELTDRVAGWVLELLRGPRTLGFVHAAIEHQTSWMLSVPIGRAGQYLPDDAVRRAEGVLFDPLWDFIQKRVPTAVTGLPIAQMVEDKLRGYPVQKVEELIRRVSQRELALIVYLGAFLGALIGSLMLFTASVPAGLAASGFFLLLSFIFINVKG